MKKTLLYCAVLILLSKTLNAHTSWKGTVSTAWATASNWTAGVPVATVDAIIGDANFTGSYQPLISGSTAACKSLTLGSSTKVSILTISKNINVSGNLVIGSNGTITQNATSVITLKGNWTNSGTYSATLATAT
ncbi:MAG: hypothetical protein ABI855_14180, partial [Bacteroidota bacterium]